MATERQLQHIERHQAEFNQLMVGERNVREYFQEHAHIPDLYERVCDDLDITPIQEDTMSIGDQANEAVDQLNDRIDERLAALLGGTAAPQKSFAEMLDDLDPRDSEASLAMYAWLSKHGRLQKIGSLEQGASLFVYSEPKGSTRAGYVAGGTKGDRIVDSAIKKAESSGAKPVKRGLCPHCYSAVVQEEGGPVLLDDDSHAKGDADVCPGNSPDGAHGLA